MKTVGIICEYNPLHLGHKKQLDTVRAMDPDCGIVCLMSGNYVQRGAPAIFDKSLRAKAAILSGADLVLELPVTAALSSAEGFAAGGSLFHQRNSPVHTKAKTGRLGNYNFHTVPSSAYTRSISSCANCCISCSEGLLPGSTGRYGSPNTQDRGLKG